MKYRILLGWGDEAKNLFFIRIFAKFDTVVYRGKIIKNLYDLSC
jgi:hypothetical protein